MITAAMTTRQERKLNYIEVEIIPSPRDEAKRESGTIHISDEKNVKYSTIIFPDRKTSANTTKDTAPRISFTENSLVVTPPPAPPLSPKPSFSNQHSKSCGKWRNDSTGLKEGEPPCNSTEEYFQELHISCEQKDAISPPRRRRALSSPSSGKKEARNNENNEDSCKPTEGEMKEVNKTRTLPVNEKLWQEDVFVKLEEDDGLFDIERGVMPEKSDSKGKEKNVCKKQECKKVSRGSARHASDLGRANELLQAVQAMQKKVRRRSSGGSIESLSDAGYSSVSQLTPASSNADLMGISPTHSSIFYLEPTSASPKAPLHIPGSKRSTELEKAFARRKLSRQKSTDRDLPPPSPVKKTFDFPVHSSCPEGTKSKSRFLHMFPGVRFGKSHSKSHVNDERNLLASLHAKKPVPLPRYNRSRHLSGDNSPEPHPCNTQKVPLASIHGTGSIDEGIPPCTMHYFDTEPYMNMMFHHKEDCHSYENVNLDQRVPEIVAKVKTHERNLSGSEVCFMIPDGEECHHTRPLPAPRTPTHHTNLCRKDSHGLSRNPTVRIQHHSDGHASSCHNGHKHQHASSGQTSSGHSSTSPTRSVHISRGDHKHRHDFAFDAAGGKKERHHEFPTVVGKFEGGLSIAAEKDSHHETFYAFPNRKPCEFDQLRNPVPEGNSRRVPDGRSKSEYVAGDEDTARGHRQKHIRSHSGGGVGTNALYASVKKTQHSPNKDELYSSDVHPVPKCEVVKAHQRASPPLGKNDRRTARNTNEHVTVDQHKHANVQLARHGDQVNGNEKDGVMLDAASGGLSKSTWFAAKAEGGTEEVSCLSEKPIHFEKPIRCEKAIHCEKPFHCEQPVYSDKPVLSEKSNHEKPSYINQPWYYGKLLRQECEYLMLSKGSSRQYLVRDSSHRAGGLMLCVLFGQKVHHYIIQVEGLDQFQMAHHNYTSVEEIIEFYHKHVIMYSSNQEPVFLGEPFLYPR